MTAQTRGPILVIEDDDEIREVVQDALEREGYSVATAIDGQDGLRRLQEIASPCMILLDLMMPIMSGGEFLAELRKTDEQIPVVIVSAWPEEAAKVRDRAQGYVKKPLALSTLLKAVSGFCSEGGRTS